jgi:TIR domain
MSSSSRKPLVFISYARKDSRRADALQRSLLPRNLEVWVDRSRLVGGQAWPIGLQQAVEKCDLMLVLLSPRSLASAYVRREYLHALSLGKPIIPLLLEAVPAFPAELSHVQWIDLTQRGNQGYYDLLLALDARGGDQRPHTRSNWIGNWPWPARRAINSSPTGTYTRR